MGKTYRGEKGAGAEYWSKRPRKIKMASYGDDGFTKRNTHRLERIEGREDCVANWQDYLDESDDDGFDDNGDTSSMG